MFGFLVELRNMMKEIYGHVGDQELRQQRHWDILQVCLR